MPPIKIDTPSGPIYLDPVTGDIVAAPAEVAGTAADGNGYDSGPGAYPPHGGLAGPSGVGGSSALGTSGTAAAAPAGGQKRITNVTNLGGGRYQYEFSDGTYQIGDSAGLTGGAAAGGGGGGGATQGQLMANQQQQAQLAEQQRQFDLTQGERKARGDQEMRLAQGAQEIGKGNTLLGLGSRPDTLIKYLYALQGQQVPQGIQNTTSNLPGYQNVIGNTNYGAAAGTAPIGGVPAPGAAPLAASAPAQQSFGAPGSNLAPLVAPGGTTITAGPGGPIPAPQYTTPPPTQVLNAGAPATATQGATSAQVTAQDDLISQGRVPRFYSNGVAIFKHGGPIPEHVIGVGLKSGKTYEFGEAGPEFVIPNNKVKDMMSLLGRGMMDNSGETDAAGNKSYATGGQINYSPSNVPSIGSQSSGFFNDPNLKNVVQRGYNSNPGVPLFPQVGLATGGGSSLVPSQQRLNALLPSEQSLYAGTLQDEFGAMPEDVFAMARKLAPQVSGLRTPRYAA